MANRKNGKDTDNTSFGDFKFQITTDNEIMLNALNKYSMMLDYLTYAKEEEQLNIEGLVNCILAEGMMKRIRDLAKKHSFESSQDFVDVLLSCEDGQEVANEIKNQERTFYQMTHDEILSHIPVEDRQGKLF